MEDGQLGWLLKNRSAKDRSQSLGVILGNMAGTIWFRQQRHLGQIVAALHDVLPPELADHIAVEGLRRNTLHLIVDSAAHRYELEMIKEALLEALNQQVNGVFIRDIKLTLGRLDEAVPPRPAQPVDPSLDRLD
jgi:predicted nucleic acid-binding Zn ribbon protein